MPKSYSNEPDQLFSTPGRLVLTTFLFLAFANAVARFGEHNPYTPYRFFLPILVIFFLSRRNVVALVSTIIAFSVYAILAWFASPFPFSTAENIGFGVHYLTIILTIFVCVCTVRRYSYLYLFRVLMAFTALCLAWSIVEFLWGVRLPNIPHPDAIRATRTFYYNENDYSASLGIVCVLLILDKKYSPAWLAFILASITVIFLNGSRFVMLGLGFFAFIEVCRLIRPTILFPVLGFISAAAVTFGWSKITDSDIIAGLAHVASLRPFHAVGSVADRTDAALYSLFNLIASAGIGLGPGGTVVMLGTPGFKLVTATSVHSLVIQFVAEFGYLAICVLLVLFAAAKSISRSLIYRFCFCFVLFLISNSSSAAAFSNYFFFAVCVLIFARDRVSSPKLTGVGV